MLTVVVTGAGGPLGSNLIRSLREAPATLRIVGTEANRWHVPLSLADRTVLIPHAREHDGYAAALERLVAEGADAIVPTHPVEVRAVAALLAAGRLAGAAVALPRLAVLERADDKLATQRVLEAAGVAVPRTLLLERPEDLAAAFRELAPSPGTPVWVRGSGAPGLGIGGAALPCREESVARAWVEHHRGWGKMIASAYLPGRNLTWMCAFGRGRLLAAAARERLEYVIPHVSPSGVTGAPAVTRTVHRADVAAAGERAVRALDDRPHGVYFVDLKEDEAGVPRVTEINAGRCGTTVHFYTRAGFNFPWLLVCLAAGLDLGWLPSDPQDVVPEDLWWLRTLDCGPVLVRGAASFEGLERLP
jgi:carbamoylphosphate synthase large subunit